MEMCLPRKEIVIIWEKWSSFSDSSFQKFEDARGPTTICLKQNSLVSDICQVSEMLEEVTSGAEKAPTGEMQTCSYP